MVSCWCDTWWRGRLRCGGRGSLSRQPELMILWKYSTFFAKITKVTFQLKWLIPHWSLATSALGTYQAMRDENSQSCCLRIYLDSTRYIDTPSWSWPDQWGSPDCLSICVRTSEDKGRSRRGQIRLHAPEDRTLILFMSWSEGNYTQFLSLNSLHIYYLHIVLIWL